MPQIKEHDKNIPEAEGRRRTFVLDTAQNNGISFSGPMFEFISARSLIVLCMYNFVLKSF